MKITAYILTAMFLLPALPANAEQVLYCQSEHATGLSFESGAWSTGKFKNQRYTIKFTNGFKSIKGNMFNSDPYTACKTWGSDVICHSRAFGSTVVLNTKSLRFVFSSISPFGFVSGRKKGDTDVLEAGTCTLF